MKTIWLSLAVILFLRKMIRFHFWAKPNFKMFELYFWMTCAQISNFKLGKLVVFRYIYILVKNVGA